MKKYLSKKSRLVIGVEGSPVAVRVVPHKTDANLLVLKSPFEEGASAFLELAKVPVVASWKGGNFYCTVVVKAEFLASLGAAFEELVRLAAEAPEVSEFVQEQVEKIKQFALLGELNGAGELPEC